ncbi:MAG: fibrillarin-like rRNA/tRNA 2'-O-methyltransferase [Methanospirillum sp.]|nr:fibrillarin-like rRNA/tRNA 2'-O-methyltransferase [Methanospirillum sp.]
MIWQDGRLLSPGKIRRGDRLHNGLRVWPPERSKLAALSYLDADPPIDNARVLYLGAAAGTTVSFVADYAEVVYAVEFSRRPMQSLIRLSQERRNIIPLFEDARHPERYHAFVEKVDIVIQDIAQPDQPEIAISNMIFLKPGGMLILFLKMFSISVSKNQDDICSRAVSKLKDAGLCEITTVSLEKYHGGHVAILGIWNR